MNNNGGYGGYNNGNGFNHRNRGNNSNKGAKPAIIIGIVAAIVILFLLVIIASGDSNPETNDVVTDTSEVESTVIETPAPADCTEVVMAEPEATMAEKNAFAQKVIANMRAGKWNAVGEPDENNQGNCSVAITNKNSFTVEGSDYVVTFNYEYDYSEPPEVISREKRNGQTVGAGSSVYYSYYYSDDCSPSLPKIKFTISNSEIYDKYHGR